MFDQDDDQYIAKGQLSCGTEKLFKARAQAEAGDDFSVYSNEPPWPVAVKSSPLIHWLSHVIQGQRYKGTEHCVPLHPLLWDSTLHAYKGSLSILCTMWHKQRESFPA